MARSFAEVRRGNRLGPRPPGASRRERRCNSGHLPDRASVACLFKNKSQASRPVFRLILLGVYDLGSSREPAGSSRSECSPNPPCIALRLP